jgi:hypothetical protein
MDGLYVLNNPWSMQSMEKHTTYCAMMKLGHADPRDLDDPAQGVHRRAATWASRWSATRRCSTSRRSASEVGYPASSSPTTAAAGSASPASTTSAAAAAAYDRVRQARHAPAEGGQGLRPVRARHRHRPAGQHRQVRPRRAAARPLQGRLQLRQRRGAPAVLTRHLPHDQRVLRLGLQLLRDAALKDGVFHPIDFANACPDSQVTSLHYHFPWLVKNMLRWTLFCAATKREMPPNLDWEPFFEIAKKDLPYRERLKGYAKIANERMETERFNEFCAKHLPTSTRSPWEFFGTESPRARPPEGRRPLPRARGRSLHRALLGPGPVLAQDRDRPPQQPQGLRASPQAAPGRFAATPPSPETEVKFTPAPANRREPRRHSSLRGRPPRRPPLAVTPTPALSKSNHKKSEPGQELRDARPGPRWRSCAQPGTPRASAGTSPSPASGTTARRCCCSRQRAATPRSASAC